MSENQVWGNGTVRNKKAKRKGGQHPENIYLEKDYGKWRSERGTSFEKGG